MGENLVKFIRYLAAVKAKISGNYSEGWGSESIRYGGGGEVKYITSPIIIGNDVTIPLFKTLVRDMRLPKSRDIHSWLCLLLSLPRCDS